MFFDFSLWFCLSCPSVFLLLITKTIYLPRSSFLAFHSLLWVLFRHLSFLTTSFSFYSTTLFHIISPFQTPLFPYPLLFSSLVLLLPLSSLPLPLSSLPPIPLSIPSLSLPLLLTLSLSLYLLLPSSLILYLFSSPPPFLRAALPSASV